MNIEWGTLFSWLNQFVLPGWCLLVILPTWIWTKRIVSAIIVFLACVYLLLMIRFLSSATGNFNSLQGVAELLSNPPILLAGWVHYLAFDLSVGYWEASDASKRGISRWLMIPCLFMTLMLGPVGLLVYLGLRTIVFRQLSDPFQAS